MIMLTSIMMETMMMFVTVRVVEGEFVAIANKVTMLLAAQGHIPDASEGKKQTSSLAGEVRRMWTTIQ